MKKLIISGSILVLTLALVTGATTAFYSDTETSNGNTLAAGAIDLGIDNESYYNGAFNPGTSWDLSYDLDNEEGSGPNGSYLFFNFNDLKPGDWGEDTISLHVNNNDAWACMAFDVTSDEDNGSTEPELDDENPYTSTDGELDKEVNFVWWADDGDNVLESNESANAKFKEGALADIGNFAVTLADATGNGIFQNGEDATPLDGDNTYYIGKAWCFGTMVLAPVTQDNQGKTGNNGPLQRGPGITCDGSTEDNSTQTDKITANVVFSAIQQRWNPDFKCEGGSVGCLDKADVMLVLDRSGSISSGEMTSLKTAAKAFVDSLNPSTNGVHVGMVSFSTTATLDIGLTDDGTAVKSSIDSLVANGFTNLQHGIKLARLELASGNDRLDTESPDVMVIVTDGAPNRCDDIGTSCTEANAKLAAEAQADTAKSDGNEIFAVGVGISLSDAAFLQNDIVSTPSNQHYFNAADYSNLSAILADIASCDQ